MIQIAVCEDRETELDQLNAVIGRCLKDSGKEAAVTMFRSGFDLLHHTANIGHFHIIFINASLNGLNGIETIRELREYDSGGLVIYLSNTERFAVSSYTVGAFYYLLKPVTEQGLCSVLRRAVEVLEETDSRAFDVRTAGSIYRIPCRKVLYMESNAHKLTIHMAGGEEVTLYGKLDEMEERLKEERRFIRIHKSVLVNAQHIFHYQSGEVVLDDGMELRVSRNLALAAKERYLMYLADGC